MFPQGQFSYCGTVTGKVAATASSLGTVDRIDQEEYLLEEKKSGVLLQQQEDHAGEALSVPATPAAGRGRASPSAVRRRRRRPKPAKNKEEAESQRRNHIAVERNRRRQMNDYLAVLRSVMPPSYAQRVSATVCKLSFCRPCHDRPGVLTSMAVLSPALAASLLFHCDTLMSNPVACHTVHVHAYAYAAVFRTMPLWFHVSRNNLCYFRGQPCTRIGRRTHILLCRMPSPSKLMSCTT